jgi:hypothetical protein
MDLLITNLQVWGLCSDIRCNDAGQDARARAQEFATANALYRWRKVICSLLRPLSLLRKL